MPIPKKIHRVWLGGPMPGEFLDYERRWRDLHPGWAVKTWGEADLAWLRNRAAFDDATLLSSKSNIARYEIVLREGGLYVDCDYEPLRSLDELLIGADLFVVEEEPGYYANSFFAAAPGHPVLVAAVEQTAESHFARPAEISPERTGPHFWTRCVRRTGDGVAASDVTVLSRQQVMPYSWMQGHLRHASFPEAWAVHHWAMSWVRDSSTPEWVGAVKRVARRSSSAAKRSVHTVKRRWDELEPHQPGRPSGRSSAYLGDGRLLVETAVGFPVLARAADLRVTPSLVLDGEWDPAIMRFARRELKSGDVVVDVGAGIGVFTLHAAWIVGRMGRVFAYEPDPGAVALLSDSVAMNAQRGLSAEVLVSDRRVGSGDAVALDEALRGVPELALVRVDVGPDGADVLASMRELLQSGSVRLLDVSVVDVEAGSAWGSLTDALRDLGERFRPVTFTIGPAGERVPLSVAAAINSDRVPHFVLEFTDPAGTRPSPAG